MGADIHKNWTYWRDVKPKLESIKGKQNTHWHNIKQGPYVNINIDKAQMGLGCVNSWGSMPLEKCLVPIDDVSFKFKIIPFKN